jgi:hypothetical protein
VELNNNSLSIQNIFIVWITTSSFDLLKLLACVQLELVITEVMVKGTGDNGRNAGCVKLLHRNKKIMWRDVLYTQKLVL